MLTLLDLVERNAQLHAEGVHLIFGERRSTFAQFRTRSLKLASAVYGLGLRAQDRVGVLAMNCSEYASQAAVLITASTPKNAANRVIAPATFSSDGAVISVASIHAAVLIAKKPATFKMFRSA